MDSPRHQRQEQHQHKQTGSAVKIDAGVRGTTAPCYSEARGVRIKHRQPSGNLLWVRNNQNKLILICQTWRENRGENGHCLKKRGEGGELPRFYVPPPVYHEASLWPSLHLHSSQMLQNRSPASKERGEEGWANGKRKGGGEQENAEHLLGSFMLRNFEIVCVF